MKACFSIVDSINYIVDECSIIYQFEINSLLISGYTYDRSRLMNVVRCLDRKEEDIRKKFDRFTIFQLQRLHIRNIISIFLNTLKTMINRYKSKDYTLTGFSCWQISGNDFIEWKNYIDRFLKVLNREYM